MKRLKNNPLMMICLLLCFCAMAVIALVTVYAAPPTNTIQACYNNTNGELRRVNAPSDCRNHETPISWSIVGPAGPQGLPGPSGANVVTFRHTHTAGNECGPALAAFSVLDNPSLNGNADAFVFVTALIGINGARTNTNPNSNLLVVYTGSASFGTCPAGRWIVGGGDIATGAQFNVMVVNP
jgi:hypothetical protein